MAPAYWNTGGKVRHPGLAEDGNRRTKDVLESAILDHRRCAPDSSLSDHQDRKIEELGKAADQTDAARKLTRDIYAMLSTGEVWRGFLPQQRGPPAERNELLSKYAASVAYPVIGPFRFRQLILGRAPGRVTSDSA